MSRMRNCTMRLQHRLSWAWMPTRPSKFNFIDLSSRTFQVCKVLTFLSSFFLSPSPPQKKRQYGKAIGFMSAARTSFGSLSKSSKAPTISHAAAFEFRLATEKVQSFQKINDSVTFHKVPSPAELLPLMPSGRDLLKVKPYLAPRPDFGSAATANEGGSEDNANKGSSYAMQGAYF